MLTYLLQFALPLQNLYVDAARSKVLKYDDKLKFYISCLGAQTNPDGTPYAPRKEQRLRAQQGSIKRRAMFSKLSTAKWLKATAQGDTAVVGFFGSVARIAATHQRGLKDRVTRDGPRVEYAQRELLGFTALDQEHIMDSVLRHLSPG